MTNTEPLLRGFQIPSPQALRDEKIRRLMVMLRTQYGGDIKRFYSANRQSGKPEERRPEVAWSALSRELQERLSCREH